MCAGRVFEFVHGVDSEQPIVTQRNVSEVVAALIASLEKDEPHIAEKVCYAFSQLAAGCRQDDGLSLLSPTFKDIVSALLATVSLLDGRLLFVRLLRAPSILSAESRQVSGCADHVLRFLMGIKSYACCSACILS